MLHISIFWQNDSNELIEMLQALDDPGIVVGNEGCEILVNYREYSRINDYIDEHPGELVLELYSHKPLTSEQAAELIESWKAQQN